MKHTFLLHQERGGGVVVAGGTLEARSSAATIKIGNGCSYAFFVAGYWTYGCRASGSPPSNRFLDDDHRCGLSHTLASSSTCLHFFLGATLNRLVERHSYQFRIARLQSSNKGHASMSNSTTKRISNPTDGGRRIPAMPRRW